MDDLLNEFLTETSEALAVLDVELVKFEQFHGNIGISFGDLDEGLGVGVTASGEGAGLRDDLRDALTEGEKGTGEDAGGTGEALSARNVHGFFAQCMAREMGGLIEHSKGSDGEIRFAVLFPNATDC